MRLLYGVVSASMAAGVALLLCGFSNQARTDTAVIVTAAPSFDPTAGIRGEERFARGAQLLLIKAGHARALVEGLAASADANVSFDGKKVIFTGKKTANDPWAIWELTLSDRSLRKVIGSETDLIRPLYLPGERIVYGRRTPQGYHLETAQLDGQDTLQLSFVSASALPVDVLADGRILFESTYPLGSGRTPEMYLVYSDGSGVESYRCDHGLARWGGRQMPSGDVVFTHGETLARFTSPLAAEASVSAPRAKYSGGIVEMVSGEWLVSALQGGEPEYSLKIWKPGAPALQSMFAQPGENLVEAVPVRSRTRPNHHPSALHDWDYANLLALDARESREGDLPASPAAVRLESLDANGHAISMGSAPVEGDGSFFVKVPADRPIRFSLVDDKGTVVRKEQGWFWIRKGEQRICVGCHTGPERASENRVPQVLLRDTTPVDLAGKLKQSPAAGSR